MGRGSWRAREHSSADHHAPLNDTCQEIEADRSLSVMNAPSNQPQREPVVTFRKLGASPQIWSGHFSVRGE